MTQSLHCLQGHSWEPTQDSAVGRVPAICPICGMATVPEAGDDATQVDSAASVADGSAGARSERSALVPDSNVDATLALPAEDPGATRLEQPFPGVEDLTVAHIAGEAPTALPRLDHQGPPPMSVESDLTLPLTDRSQQSGFAGAPKVDATERVDSPTVPHHITLSDSQLLAAQGETTEAFAPTSDASGVRTVPAEGHGRRRAVTAPPGYEILGELGRGGMGVVYKARQMGLNRLVALKMILAGGRASLGDQSRFRIEAEAVARMQHPNIVQIYEVGEHEGQPFFSLEFVDGGALDERINGNPQPARQAATLVKALADAMDYAHRRGIVHRDLKPANILLTRTGGGDGSGVRGQESGVRGQESGTPSARTAALSSLTPKITDFGLAKQLEGDSGQTREGAIMGTPSYMAPEQARGRTREIGPPADVYALGAILYDLLTGGPPFRGETVMDTLQQVLHREPLAPRALQEKVPHDLETICLKCLEKDSARRYASASDLAEDLRRFLEEEPILARPTPAWERAWKWAKRRPAAAALVLVSAAAVLGLIAGGFGYAHAQARYAEEGRQQARTERDLREEADRKTKHAQEQERRADAERLRAEANFRRATAAVDEMLARVGRERLAHEPRMEKVRRELLQKAAGFYERFLDERAEDPPVRWQTARTHLNLGDIQRMLGRPDEAEKHYCRSLDLLKELVQSHPQDAGYRSDQAAAWNNLGAVLVEVRRLDDATANYRLAWEARGQLVKEAPDDAALLHTLAGTVQNLGQVLRQRGQLAEAETAFQQALDLQKRLVATSPLPAHRRELARTSDNFGLLLLATGRTADAQKHHDAAHSLLIVLVREAPDVPEYREDLALVHNHLGHLLRDTNPAEAEKHYREASHLGDALVKDFPATPAYRQALAATLNNLGVLLQATGRRDHADAAFQQAVDLKHRLATEVPWVPDFRRDLAATLNNRGIQLQTQNRLTDAEPVYERAVTLLRSLAGEHADAADYLQELARTLLNQAALSQSAGKPVEAEARAAAALAVQRRLVDSHPKTLEHRQELARMSLNQAALFQLNGKATNAEKAYRQAIDVLQKLVADSPTVPDYCHLLALASGNLGNLLRDTKRPKEAVPLWERSRALLARLAAEQPRLPTYRRDLATGLNEWAVFLASERKNPQATAAWQQSRGLQEALVKDFPGELAYRQDLARTLGNLGVLAAQAKDGDQAEKWYRQAIAVLEPTPFVHDLLTQLGNLTSLLNATSTSDAELNRLPAVLNRLVGQLKDPSAPPATVHLLSLRLQELGTWLVDRSRTREARPWLEEAVRQEKRAIQAAPNQQMLQQSLLLQQEALTEVLLRLGDHAAAARSLEEQAKLPAGDGSRMAESARRLARCAALAAGDPMLQETERPQTAVRYASRAMDWLRKACDNGFKNATFLKSEDFDVLRDQDEFKKLQDKLNQ